MKLEKGVWQFRTKKKEKIHNIYKNNLRAFALKNYSEGPQNFTVAL